MHASPSSATVSACSCWSPRGPDGTTAGLCWVTLAITVASGLVGVATSWRLRPFSLRVSIIDLCSTGAQVLVPFVTLSGAGGIRRGRTVGNVMAGVLTGIVARPRSIALFISATRSQLARGILEFSGADADHRSSALAWMMHAASAQELHTRTTARSSPRWAGCSTTLPVLRRRRNLSGADVCACLQHVPGPSRACQCCAGNDTLRAPPCHRDCLLWPA